MEMIMDEEELPDEIRKAIIDRYESWELVELLGISITDVVDSFEQDILDNLPDIKEELRINDEQDEQDDEPLDS